MPNGKQEDGEEAYGDCSVPREVGISWPLSLLCGPNRDSGYQLIQSSEDDVPLLQAPKFVHSVVVSKN